MQEALGKPSEALTLYDLAGTGSTSVNEDEVQEVQRNAARLRAAGAHSSAADTVQALQQMRTFKVRPATKSLGSGAFRLQLAGKGVVDCDLINGDENLRPMCADIRKLEIPHAAPQGSTARVLRDGVLSCSALFPTCELVLLPRSGLNQEKIH